MIDDKITELEERLGKRVKELEKRLEDIGRRIEHSVERAVGTEKQDESGRKRGSSLFWGIVFLAAGLIWLGNNLGWFYTDVPWLAILLIAGGVTLIIRHAASEPREHDR
ncbi:hypothetical protein JXO52_00560 [bacterium]|nr:hypothetical protein [bacterium]